eukprot:scaffold931_cov383-Prasinococcus_capsulatus_cf.AAC.4
MCESIHEAPWREPAAAARTADERTREPDWRRQVDDDDVVGFLPAAAHPIRGYAPPGVIRSARRRQGDGAAGQPVAAVAAAPHRSAVLPDCVRTTGPRKRPRGGVQAVLIVAADTRWRRIAREGPTDRGYRYSRACKTSRETKFYCSNL